MGITSLGIKAFNQIQSSAKAAYTYIRNTIPVLRKDVPDVFIQRAKAKNTISKQTQEAAASVKNKVHTRFNTVKTRVSKYVNNQQKQFANLKSGVIKRFKEFKN